MYENNTFFKAYPNKIFKCYEAAISKLHTIIEIMDIYIETTGRYHKCAKEKIQMN